MCSEKQTADSGQNLIHLSISAFLLSNCVYSLMHLIEIFLKNWAYWEIYPKSSQYFTIRYLILYSKKNGIFNQNRNKKFNQFDNMLAWNQSSENYWKNRSKIIPANQANLAERLKQSLIKVHWTSHN